MTNDDTLSNSAASLKALRRIDDGAARFEADWNAGKNPKIEEYLASADEPERPALFRELLLSELELRRDYDTRVMQELYEARFPQYGEIVRAAFAEAAKEDDDGIDLSFLEPSTKPGSIGRLGHFEVLEVIGQGGFGVVLRAFDDVLQRVVAIKVMSPRMAATSPPRKRFLREARAAGGLHHDNVVQIYEVQEQPIPYLVMEYIKGETLQQRVERTGPLELVQILRIGHHVANALAAAHAKQLIHRDIKPGNILLECDVDERVKVTDFGLARTVDDASITQSGTIAGTPLYMAPEQARGEVIDCRADLFSLGSVMYEMCVGHPPFRAASAVSVLVRVVEDTPRPIRDIIPELPTWLVDLIAKLHAKNPAERFQTAREVADLLGQYLTEVQTLGIIREPRTPELSKSEPRVMPGALDDTLLVSRPARRRFAPTIAALCVGVVLIGGIAGYLQFADTLFNTAKKDPLGEKDGAQPKPPAVVPVPGPVAQVPLPLPPGPVVKITQGEGWPNRAMFLSGSQTAVFSNSNFVNIWDLKENRRLRQIDKHGRFVHVWGLAISSDGQRILTGDEKGKIFLWSGATGDVIREFANPTGSVGHLAFVPESLRFVSLDNTGDLRIWNTESGNSEKSGNLPVKDGDDWFAIAFSAEASRLLLGRMDGSLRLVEVQTGKELRLWKAHETRVTAVAFSRDGRYALSAGNDGAIRLWDLKTEEEAGALTGHAGAVHAIAFSPDGRRAVSGGADKTVRVWNLTNRKEIECFRGHKGPVMQVDVSSDGKYALSMTLAKDELAILWRLPEDAGQDKGTSPSLAHAPFNATNARSHQDAWAKTLDTQPVIANSIRMKLAVIPPGTFLMGSPDEEPGRAKNESPRREVRLTKPFAIGVHAVTVGQFKTFVNEENYKTEAESSGLGALTLQGDNWVLDANANWRNPGFEQTDDHPVVCVSWNDAVAFCAWLSKKEGKKYNLPTEAQWEYACRAGTETTFFFGDNDEHLPEYVWFGSNSDRRTHPVGEKKPNAWGLHDMHGHVWQWVADWYGDSYYATAERDNPLGPKFGDRHSLRGGDWYCGPTQLRSAFRGHHDARNSNGGFRVVVELGTP